MSLRILISAGEVSGDQHLARVVSALKRSNPDCEIRGMAGRACKQAGAILDVDCYRAGAGMGFLEIFRSAGAVFRSFTALKGLLVDWKPDILILVDYPDFNLRLAKRAKRHGVKVLYYIPPKVWAWRRRRVRLISKVVDRIAAIFPFEPEFYRKHGFNHVTFVGHPLADRLTSVKLPEQREDTLLLLPGSRRSEVERLLAPMLQAYEVIRAKGYLLRPVVVLAPNIDPEWVKGPLGSKVSQQTLSEVVWSHEDALQAMAKARVAVLKSGTCNLEAALAELPFVCVYSGTQFSKFIVDRFVSLQEFSPVNIIKPKTVSEVMEVDLDPQHVVNALEPIAQEGGARRAMILDLQFVREQLTGSGGREVADRVATCVLEMVVDKDSKARGCSHV